MKTIGILGYPGAGKTWAVYQLIQELINRGIVPGGSRIGLVDYIQMGTTAIMGIYDGTKFQGTDRLSMAVSVDFEKFFEVMKLNGITLILAEGDRINNMVFFQNALKHGSLERIKCNPDTYEKLLKQREQRNHVFKPAFLKTVASKVDKHNFDQVLNSDKLFDYLLSLHE